MNKKLKNRWFRVLFCICSLLFVLSQHPTIAMEKLANEEMATVTGQEGIGAFLNNFRVKSDPSNNENQRLRIKSQSNNTLSLGNFNWCADGGGCLGMDVGSRNDPFELEADGGNPAYVEIAWPENVNNVDRFNLDFNLRMNNNPIGRAEISNAVNPATYFEIGSNDNGAQLGIGIALNGSGGLDVDDNGIFGSNDLEIRNNNSVDPGLFFADSYTGTLDDPPTEDEFFSDDDYSDDLLTFASLGEDRPLFINFIDDGSNPKVEIERQRVPPTDNGGNPGSGTLGINQLDFGNADLGHSVIDTIKVRHFRFVGPQ